ncbi:MAG: ureidoglycolate lyase [Propionivibrio sp.]
MLECHPRKLRLERMERHHRTREILTTLEGEAAICLAPPQESSSGSLDGVVALRMSAGQSIILEVGAWHWIPFPTTDQTARFQVIFRSETGKDDLDFFHFSPSLDIE